VHHDIKLENVMFKNEHRCLKKIALIDFGEALFSKDKVIADYSVGSAYYMAPEVVMN
jgi:serine/threonine protein kinase